MDIYWLDVNNYDRSVRIARSSQIQNFILKKKGNDRPWAIHTLIHTQKDVDRLASVNQHE